MAERSGIPRLIERLERDLLPRAVLSLREAAALEASTVSTHLSLALQAELETLVRPGEAALLVQTFEDAQATAADLNKRASRWQVLSTTDSTTSKATSSTTSATASGRSAATLSSSSMRATR